MIRLHLFGPVELRADDGHPLAGGVLQPKRSAILAYLAVCPSRRARRDTLLALFWPELDDARGRKALNQSLHYLRGILGDDALVSYGDEQVGLSPDRVWSDAVAFDEAMAGGRLDEALDLHRADFLQGLFLPDLVEFERWVEEERQRRRRAATEAAWTLADRAADVDSTEALRRAREAMAWGDEGDERGLRRILLLHDRFGDRAGALRVYEEFARRLEEEWEVAPAPETRAVVEAIRARSTVNDGLEGADAQAIGPARSMRAPPSAGTRRSRFRWALTGALAGAAGITWFLGSLAATGGGRADTDGLPEVTLGSSTTTVPSALEAFREGERHRRSGRFTAATEALRRAVDGDTTFALAYLRLSQAANWSGAAQLATWANEGATRHAVRLDPDARRHAEAWSLYLAGQAIRAETLYREIVRDDPEDVEAWARLAEIAYHWAPMWGAPPEAATPTWETVARLDPRNVAATVHLARLAARRGDSASVRASEARMRGLDVDGSRVLEVEALRAFGFGSPADRERAAAALSTMELPVRGEVVAEVAASTPYLEGVGDLLIPALRVGRSFTNWQAGELALAAGAFLAEGRRARADAVLDSAAVLEPLRALEYRAAAAAVPLPVTPVNEVLRLREALRASSALPGSEYYMARVWRLYLEGLLSARAGDTEGAGRAVASLGGVAASPADDEERAFAEWFARLIRAEGLRAEGRPAEALALLGEPGLEPDLRLPRVWSQHRAHDRFLRAELLEATGRFREALAWYATFPDPTAFDLPWTLAAVAARARMHGRLGEEDDVRRLSRRLERVLRASDPGVRETVLEAAGLPR